MEVARRRLKRAPLGKLAGARRSPSAGVHQTSAQLHKAIAHRRDPPRVLVVLVALAEEVELALGLRAILLVVAHLKQVRWQLPLPLSRFAPDWSPFNVDFLVLASDLVLPLPPLPFPFPLVLALALLALDPAAQRGQEGVDLHRRAQGAARA